MLADYPLLKQRSPLIEMGLTKKNTHAILKQRGVRRPWVYEIGMPNGNCIGCVKSSSPNYWALIRKWFPEVFERRNNQARRRRLTVMFGQEDVVTGFLQVLSHGQAHDAGADESDFSHDLSPLDRTSVV